MDACARGRSWTGGAGRGCGGTEPARARVQRGAGTEDHHDRPGRRRSGGCDDRNGGERRVHQHGGSAPARRVHPAERPGREDQLPPCRSQAARTWSGALGRVPHGGGWPSGRGHAPGRLRKRLLVRARLLRLHRQGDGPGTPDGREAGPAGNDHGEVVVRTRAASCYGRDAKGERSLSPVVPLLFLALLSLAGCSPLRGGAQPGRLDAIQHIVVIYAENRSFDHLYGLFPGANGIRCATRTVQVDRDGKPLRVLPPVWKPAPPGAPDAPAEPDPAFPSNLPNAPFRIDAAPINLGVAAPTRDLVHRYYQNRAQINRGRLDRYVAMSDGGALPMGNYDGSPLPMWALAREYTLADNFFMGAFGGSFLNHFWLVCPCTPVDPDARWSGRVMPEENGELLARPGPPASAMSGPPSLFDGNVTPDGYAVNTEQPPFQPSQIPPAPGGDPRFADPAKHPLPAQHEKT